MMGEDADDAGRSFELATMLISLFCNAATTRTYEYNMISNYKRGEPTKHLIMIIIARIQPYSTPTSN